VAELLPHHGAARLLTDVVARDGAREIECLGCIPGTSPFAAQGSAPAFMAIELAAQAAALLEALARGDAGGDSQPRVGRVGYLVGVREARFTRPHVPTEETLRVQVRLLGEAPPLAKYAVTVSGPEADICHAILSTHTGAGA
jgi:predicted hotdog family 3-hydroxylacyl-ACP dehydratase